MSTGTLEDSLKTCFPLLESCNTLIELSIYDYNPGDSMFFKHESSSEAWKAFKNTSEGSACFYLSTHIILWKKALFLPDPCCVQTCCGDDAVTALTTEAWEQAGLSSTCQADAHHIVLWSWRRGSFTAQCPETLKQDKQNNEFFRKQKQMHVVPMEWLGSAHGITKSETQKVNVCRKNSWVFARTLMCGTASHTEAQNNKYCHNTALVFETC